MVPEWKYSKLAMKHDKLRSEQEKMIKALKLCVLAIENIHPNLDPDEPCIAYEAHEAATSILSKIKSDNKEICLDIVRRSILDDYT